jgi:hypothetical protein
VKVVAFGKIAIKGIATAVANLWVDKQDIQDHTLFSHLFDMLQIIT